MRKLSLLSLVAGAAFALAPGAAEACSMCRWGDPTFALVGSQVFVPDTWHLGLDVDRYAKDQVGEEDPASREQEVEDRLTLSGTRTLGNRLTLVVRLPFSSRSITAAGER